MTNQENYLPPEKENVCECGEPCYKEYCSEACAKYYITED